VGHVELHDVYETRADIFFNGSRQALLNDTERKLTSSVSTSPRFLDRIEPDEMRTRRVHVSAPVSRASQGWLPPDEERLTAVGAVARVGRTQREPVPAGRRRRR
jgi:hypothetical protein